MLARGGGRAADLAGRRVVVTAGGTREPLDPVRFLGNRSSGRQGYALARAAVARGAEVTLVAANVALPDPAGATWSGWAPPSELRDAVLAAAADADAVVMAAAVADFRPAGSSPTKDQEVGASRPRRVELVAQPRRARRARPAPPGRARCWSGSPPRPTTCSSATAGRSCARKGCDLLVVNEVGDGTVGFESRDNAATVLGADGGGAGRAARPKDAGRRRGLGPRRRARWRR